MLACALITMCSVVHANPTVCIHHSVTAVRAVPVPVHRAVPPAVTVRRFRYPTVPSVVQPVTAVPVQSAVRSTAVQPAVTVPVAAPVRRRSVAPSRLRLTTCCTYPQLCTRAYQSVAMSTKETTTSSASSPSSPSSASSCAISSPHHPWLQPARSSDGLLHGARVEGPPRYVRRRASVSPGAGRTSGRRIGATVGLGRTALVRR